ncbi:alginate O-acetyltransferase AlgX-related protein [Dinoroseobacter sp. S124A]|uniref:alginate O-acetyltransferase AlgX-related protein n=1 Tax=Dinoroseobacter sp. S124A TaxID=3415128 RepID=UPI003C7DC5DA
MDPKSDTVIPLALTAGLAALSVAALINVDAGTPLEGWADGSYQRSFEARFETALPTQSAAVELWAALRWQLFREPAQGAVAGQGGWLFTAEEFAEPEAPRDLAAELAHARSVLAARGIQLAPVIVPDKARMQAHRLPRGRSAGFAGRYDRALATVAAAGLPVIDLRPALDFDTSFLRSDTHWSPEGAHRAAEAIAAALADTPLAQSTVETRKTGFRAFEGDLAAFVATGALRPHVGPHPDLIRTYDTAVASAGGLFGAAEIPVALVGTSFSAKPAFHFAGFLSQALQVDLLNASAVGQGPFAPMDAFLAELDTLSTPPTLVLWEIPERYLTARSPQS